MMPCLPAFIVVLSGWMAVEDGAQVEPVAVTVPGQGWQIEFDAPPLLEFSGGRRGEAFQYRAAGERSFILSIFVEPPKGKGSHPTDCFEHYWPLAKRNPMIDQQSVKVTKTDDYVKVTYTVIANVAGTQSKIANANYYFAHEGRWIDVHASIYPPTDKEAETFQQFEQSLKLGRLPADVANDGEPTPSKEN